MFKDGYDEIGNEIERERADTQAINNRNYGVNNSDPFFLDKVKPRKWPTNEHHRSEGAAMAKFQRAEGVDFMEGLRRWYSLSEPGRWDLLVEQWKEDGLNIPERRAE